MGRDVPRLRDDGHPALLDDHQELLHPAAVGRRTGPVRDDRLLHSRRGIRDEARQPRPHGPAVLPLVAAHAGGGGCRHRRVPDRLRGDASRRRHRQHPVRAGIRRAELFVVGAVHVADQDHHGGRPRAHAAAGDRHLLPERCGRAGRAAAVSYELIAIMMFSAMLLMLLTGQRVFGAIGFVAGLSSLMLWGEGGSQLPFSAAMKLMKWYPLLTLPMFIYMGYVLSESKLADDLYKMFHVWSGRLRGGLAV